MNRPKLLVFASGSATGGGSGFQKLVEASHQKGLLADIVGVVSNHANGGVRARAGKLRIPFIHFSKPWNEERYQRIASVSEADFFALSGWLKLVVGLDAETKFNSTTVFNVHPGPLPQFGGPGMYGHYVHEAVLTAFERKEIAHSAVSMHFVTPEYDQGPLFFNYRVPVWGDDTPEDLGARVNHAEHYWQARITNLVVNGQIHWDGKDPASLVVPPGYEHHQPG